MWISSAIDLQSLHVNLNELGLYLIAVSTMQGENLWKKQYEYDKMYVSYENYRKENRKKHRTDAKT